VIDHISGRRTDVRYMLSILLVDRAGIEPATTASKSTAQLSSADSLGAAAFFLRFAGARFHRSVGFAHATSCDRAYTGCESLFRGAQQCTTRTQTTVSLGAG